MTTEPDYVWSTNNEEFPYESLDDLLGCNEELVAGSVVYRGVRQDQDAAIFAADSYDVTGRMEDNAYATVDEHSDGWPEPTNEARAELDELLKEWARKHCGPCPFYLVGSPEPYTITEDDLK